MARPELHFFKDDLKNRPLPKSKQPPRTIRARDLDDNFKKVTILESDDDPPQYRTEYTDEGVVLRDLRGVPEGATAREFSVCENGTPKTYWLLTWTEEPEL
jgi:hypothetical protein